MKNNCIYLSTEFLDGGLGWSLRIGTLQNSFIKKLFLQNTIQLLFPNLSYLKQGAAFYSIKKFSVKLWLNPWKIRRFKNTLTLQAPHTLYYKSQMTFRFVLWVCCFMKHEVKKMQKVMFLTNSQVTAFFFKSSIGNALPFPMLCYWQFDLRVDLLPYGHLGLVLCGNNQLTGFHSIKTLDVKSFLSTRSRKLKEIVLWDKFLIVPETGSLNQTK